MAEIAKVSLGFDTPNNNLRFFAHETIPEQPLSP
jgi:hypothetical protein